MPKTIKVLIRAYVQTSKHLGGGSYSRKKHHTLLFGQSTATHMFSSIIIFPLIDSKECQEEKKKKEKK